MPRGSALACVVGLSVLALPSCDRTAPDRPAPAPALRAAAPADAGPVVPTAPPKITVDGHGCTVDDKPFAGPPTAWRVKVEELLLARPRVEGEEVAIDAVGSARMPRVTALVADLLGAKVKSVVVRTRTRAGSDEALALARDGAGAAPCAPSLVIEQDLTVRLSSAAAPHPETVPRGEMGLDVARVAEALGKRLASCDTPSFKVSAADTVPWAAPFEILLGAGRIAADAGKQPRPFIVEFEPPDAGRPRKRAH
jgi:hypothetical protein